MKKIILLFVLIFSLSTYSQKKDFVCKIDHKCSLKKEIDDFVKADKYSIMNFKNLPVMRKTFFDFPYILSKTIYKETGTKSVLINFVSGINACSNSDSNVHIILKNGESIILKNASDRIDCGDYASINTQINESDLNSLLKIGVKKIRFQFSDNHMDFELTEKYEKRFLNDLLCLNSAE